MNRAFRTVAFLAAIGTAAVAFADVKLPAVFGDGMVLQRDATLPVWGSADPGEKVTVSIAGQAAPAVADDAGKWKVELKPLKAGGPLEMTVVGKNTIALKDILVGEVWVCSGQSNMAFAVGSANNAAEEIKAADYPKLRLFTVPRRSSAEPQTDVVGRWSVCTPQTARGFSAVGYFFGRDLQKAIDVPIGLIHTSWGATAAELWTSREALAAVAQLAGMAKQAEAMPQRLAAAQGAYRSAMAKWEAEAAEAKAAGRQPPARPRPPSAGMYPSCLYNAMIAPLIPFRIAGAIWYQGEANARNFAGAVQYQVLFPTMIRDWRTRWGCDFPFLFVQLANYKARANVPTDTAWARLRESQSKTLALPATGMAVIIDIGEGGNIHPKDKQDVGRRLALAARALVYGEKGLEYSGPVFQSMKVADGKAVLTFDHVGGGLVAKGGKLVGFAVAGADRKFVWADATIDGNTVVVSAAAVSEPVAVRYAWADNPECNLYNEAGLPASPFRTDDWEP